MSESKREVWVLEAVEPTLFQVPAGTPLAASPDREQLLRLGDNVHRYVPASSTPEPAAADRAAVDIELEADRFLGRYGEPFTEWQRKDLYALLRDVAAKSTTEALVAASPDRYPAAPASHPAEVAAPPGEQAVTVRPLVRWFAAQMELALRRNDHKGGWHECSRHSLLARVLEESSELIEAINPEETDIVDWACAARNVRFSANLIASSVYFMRTTGDPGEVLAEAADIANMAMMVADHFREGGPSQDQGQSLLPAPPKGTP